MKHLLSIADIKRDEIEAILGRAESFAEVGRRDIKKVPTLRGRTVVNLFFESSTRTSLMSAIYVDSSEVGTSRTRSTSSISTSCTWMRSPREVGRFLPT